MKSIYSYLKNRPNMRVIKLPYVTYHMLHMIFYRKSSDTYFSNKFCLHKKVFKNLAIEIPEQTFESCKKCRSSMS